MPRIYPLYIKDKDIPMFERFVKRHPKPTTAGVILELIRRCLKMEEKDE